MREHPAAFNRLIDTYVERAPLRLRIARGARHARADPVDRQAQPARAQGRRRAPQDRRGRVVSHPAGAVLRPGRRERLRQDHDRARDHAAPARRALEIDGAIRFGGRDLAHAGERTLRPLRGSEIAMIFQEPMSSLNPLMTVERQLTEAMDAHGKHKGRDRRAHIIDLLSRVRFREPGADLARLSARALRRHAPARHDRERAHQRAETPDRRRADDLARRDHPAPGARHHRKPRAQLRAGRAVHLARSVAGLRECRRDRGALRRRADGARAGARGHRTAGASLHGGAARLRAASARRRAPGGNRGLGAERRRLAAGLPLRRSLPLRSGRNAARARSRSPMWRGGRSAASRR